MSAYVSDIAAAVVAALNEGASSSGEFSQEFTAEHIYVPETNYSGVQQLQVKVFAVGVERTRMSRGTIRKDPELAIVIANRISLPGTDPTHPEHIEELDDAMALADEIADFITLNGPYAGSDIIRVDVDPIFDFETLRTHRVFVTALRAFFFAA